MPNAMTRADSIRAYNTGAGSDGAAQTNADASLGNYRSATEISVLAVVRNSAIANITLDYVAGANGTGTGTLTASGANDLRWTPPGGTQGAAVTIANGETKVLEGGGSDGASKYIRVSRTSAAALTGTETDDLSDVVNNAVGFDNVSSAEAAAGDNEYRCIGYKNVGSVAVGGLTFWLGTLGTQRTSDTGQLSGSGSGTISTSGSLADWPDSGCCQVRDNAGTLKEIVYYSSRTSTTLTVPSAGRGLGGTSATAGAATDTITPVPPIRIGYETPGGGGNVQTIANESTAPTGITWNTSITQAAGVSIGTLSAGAWRGLWVHRFVSAGAVAAASVLNKIQRAFDAA